MINVVYIPALDSLETATSVRRHTYGAWLVVFSIALQRNVAALYLGPL